MSFPLNNLIDRGEGSEFNNEQDGEIVFEKKTPNTNPAASWGLR